MENNMTVYGVDYAGELTTSGGTTFTSIKAETIEDKAKLFNAMNNPDFRLGDCINRVIKIKDLFCETVQCTNQETGEVTDAPRIVVIDEDGKSYQAVSVGVLSAFKKLIAIFGAPTWEPAIPIMVKQITRGQNKMLTFEIIKDK